MANTGPVLRIRNEDELQDLIDAEGRDATLIERDFDLTRWIASSLGVEVSEIARLAEQIEANGSPATRPK